MTGTAVTLPLIITLIVLGIVVNFVSNQLDPVVGVLATWIGFQPASETILKLTAIGALLTVIVLVGAVTEYRSESSDLGAFFDALLSRIPVIGSFYRSLDEMSSLLLDNDTESFQDVKLVEFPTQGSFAVAFLTADTPPSSRRRPRPRTW